MHFNLSWLDGDYKTKQHKTLLRGPLQLLLCRNLHRRNMILLNELLTIGSLCPPAISQVCWTKVHNLTPDIYFLGKSDIWVVHKSDDHHWYQNDQVGKLTKKPVSRRGSNRGYSRCCNILPNKCQTEVNH